MFRACYKTLHMFSQREHAPMQRSLTLVAVSFPQLLQPLWLGGQVLCQCMHVQQFRYFAVGHKITVDTPPITIVYTIID